RRRMDARRSGLVDGVDGVVVVGAEIAKEHGPEANRLRQAVAAAGRMPGKIGLEDAMPELTGGCSCGVVRYRLTSDPMFVHCCHSTLCQRQTGSAFVINAITETDRIELRGAAPEPVSMPTESGRPHDIYRCAACRIAVWSDYGRRGVMRFVRVG